jgi:hypothetical protein
MLAVCEYRAGLRLPQASARRHRTLPLHACYTLAYQEAYQESGCILSMVLLVAEHVSIQPEVPKERVGIELPNLRNLVRRKLSTVRAGFVTA